MNSNTVAKLEASGSRPFTIETFTSSMQKIVLESRYSNATEISKRVEARMVGLSNKGVTEICVRVLAGGEAAIRAAGNALVQHRQLNTVIAIALDHRRLIEVPSVVCELVHLDALYLNGNRLQSLPSELWRLSKLKKLEAANNSFEVLPLVVCELLSLEQLELGANRLQTLPAEISKLTRLRELTLTENASGFELPAAIGALVNLEKLCVGENEIKPLPQELGGLVGLKFLALTRCKLSEVPRVVCEMKGLESLNLSGNPLRTVSVELAKLGSLTYLDMSNCQVSEMPAAVCELRQLKELKMDRNLLTDLPYSMLQLTALQSLSLQSNQLCLIPALVGRLPSLLTLIVGGNPLVGYQSPLVKSTTWIPSTKLLSYIRKAALLEVLVLQGLAESNSNWSNFLKRGLYDPRLFLSVWIFIVGSS